jgi:phosphoglycolate phosphatase-like HAD superfamily hydrolase
MKLILFDVDGILIKEGSIHIDYWKIIVRRHFGVSVSTDDIYKSGKTDRQILVELLANKGVRTKASDPRIERAIGDIGPIVKRSIKGKKLEKIANIERLIKLLRKNGIVIGLLTGNTPGKSEAKLRSAGLWKYFKIGAFGDATIKRSKLVPIAIKNAKNETGTTFRKGNVFLIGDTIRDVRCAKEGKVKSIAVATGKESIEQLKNEKPDYLFKDFSNQNISKMIRIIKGN